MSLSDVLSRIDTDLDASLDRLMALLRIPSISTDPAYKAECDRAADWLVADLASLGADVAKHPTPGHPMVMGTSGDGPRHFISHAGLPGAGLIGRWILVAATDDEAGQHDRDGSENE